MTLITKTIGCIGFETRLMSKRVLCKSNSRKHDSFFQHQRKPGEKEQTDQILFSNEDLTTFYLEIPQSQTTIYLYLPSILELSLKLPSKRNDAQNSVA